MPFDPAVIERDIGFCFMPGFGGFRFFTAHLRPLLEGLLNRWAKANGLTLDSKALEAGIEKLLEGLS